MAKHFVIHTADLRQVFTYGTKWNDKKFYRKLEELKNQIEFVPGLLVMSDKGQLYRPELSVWMTSVKEK